MDTLVFDSPVGTFGERMTEKIWPGSWFIAMGYNQPYPPTLQRYDYHTGVDLNLPNMDDSGKPVYAAADGIVVAAGLYSIWGGIIVIKHTLNEVDHTLVWTRYAHIAYISVHTGQEVRRGTQIAVIADYGRKGKVDDHLHYDVCRIDLGAHPIDWPGTNRVRLVKTYVDPAAFTKQHHKR